MDFKKYSESYINFYTDKPPSDIFEGFFNKNKSGFSIVDLGCGDGSLIFSLYRNNLKDAEKIIGVDLSPERIERLKLQKIPNLEAICSDACNVKQLENNSIDYVLNSGVIEHVEDDRKLLAEIHRMLKKEGLVYIMTIRPGLN